MTGLAEHLRARTLDALNGIPAEERPKIYVVSLFVYDEDDDPRRPTITVGFNTEADVEAATPGPGNEGDLAWDAEEARWNYAFYRQNKLVVICDSDLDAEGAAHREAWARKSGYWYSDAEEAADFEATIERGEALTREFVHCAVDVARRLHGNGDITRIFGRPIPVLIHELEYYETIAAQNLAANPPGLVEDFVRFCRGDSY